MRYYVSSKEVRRSYERWHVSYKPAHRGGGPMPAGTVTRDRRTGYWDVRHADGEPCPIGSPAYKARRAAVRLYSQEHAWDAS